jgi:excisionase family DNA binding protein
MTGPDGASVIARVWLSVHESSQHTGCSKTEIYEALQTGDLIGSQKNKGGKWRVHVHDLDRWMRRNQANVA